MTVAPSNAASNAAPLPPTRLPLGLLESATVRRLVVGIWILWACLLLGGTLLCESVRGGTIAIWKDQILLVSHLGSSALLVAAGWIWFLGFNRSPAAVTCGLFAAGMTLGAIGDCFNGGVLQKLIPLPDPVLGGIAAFALGHIAYITGCVRVAWQNGFHSSGKRLAAILFWQVFGIVAWFFVVYAGTNRGAGLLVWPALPYSLLLTGTAGIATYLALEDRRFLLLAMGAVLFLVSDLILAFRMFHGEFAMAGHAVWLTYGPAQMLIVYSIGAVGAASTRVTR
jgi:YhhN family